MRHTRNCQIKKLRKWNRRTNLRIGKYSNPNIDKTFKWHRECYPYGFNFIEIDDRESLILIKV